MKNMHHNVYHAVHCITTIDLAADNVEKHESVTAYDEDQKHNHFENFIV